MTLDILDNTSVFQGKSSGPHLIRNYKILGAFRRQCSFELNVTYFGRNSNDWHII